LDHTVATTHHGNKICLNYALAAFLKCVSLLFFSFVHLQSNVPTNQSYFACILQRGPFSKDLNWQETTEKRCLLDKEVKGSPLRGASPQPPGKGCYILGGPGVQPPDPPKAAPENRLETCPIAQFVGAGAKILPTAKTCHTSRTFACKNLPSQQHLHQIQPFITH